MNTKRSLGFTTLAVCLLVSAHAQAAGASGQAIAFTCAGCHGTDGVSQGTVPSLKGKDATTLNKMLLAYKQDKNEGTVMNRIAKGYSDEEIAAVSDYFARLK